MKTKDYLRIALASVILCFAIVPLGGYGGHQYKFAAACLLFAALTYYFLGKASSRHEKRLVLLWIAIPPIAIYFPIHVTHFYGTLFGLPSTIAQFIGILSGATAYTMRKEWKILPIVLLTALCTWVLADGYGRLKQKLNYGTWTGKITAEAPVEITGVDELGRFIDDRMLMNKVVVLDFWNTSCGNCYRQFPKFQKLYDRYKSNPEIQFFALNKPMRGDTAGQAFAELKGKYTFPIMVPEMDTLPKVFGVHSYPTTIVLDRAGFIVFRGDIRYAGAAIRKLLKHNY